MNMNQRVKLTRDCRAKLIPSGDSITLKEGQEVTITQSLGGSFTVVLQGNMARIEGADADALGMEQTTEVKSEIVVELTPEAREEAVWDQLRTVYDPEIPVNIVDLGLIYDLQLNDPGNGQGVSVVAKMTLTAPGCGMGPAIADDARGKILMVPGVTDVAVDLVWEPMWNQAMMTEAAKLKLGFL
ncbi:putative Fe-S cluster assembly protein SufT [Candidatus Neomarinimicrobiota bacterium]